MIAAFARIVGVKVIGGVMAALGVIIAFMTAYGRGRRAAQRDVAAASADSTDRMLDAAVNSPKEKRDVAADLRAGKF